INASGGNLSRRFPCLVAGSKMSANFAHFSGAAMIRGSIVAIVTPMHADGAVDWERLRRLVDWHVKQGTHALVAVGTTGESATLGFEEHDPVSREIISAAAGRVPVIAGTGGNSTEEA